MLAHAPAAHQQARRRCRSARGAARLCVPSASASARQCAAPPGCRRAGRRASRGVLQHERARGTAWKRRVGQRRAERVERRPAVALPQADRAQRVEIVSARLGLPCQGPLDDRLRLRPPHGVLQERPREVVRRSGIVGRDRHRAPVGLDRARARRRPPGARLPGSPARAPSPAGGRRRARTRSAARRGSSRSKYATPRSLCSLRRQRVPGRPRRDAADEGQAEGERRPRLTSWSWVRDGRRRRSRSRTAQPAKPESLAQRAHQVALVREVERRGIVDEQEEGRRAGGGLRPVEDLERLAVELPPADAASTAAVSTRFSSPVEISLA